MPHWKCPLCESPVRAKEVTPYSRLSCGKCHADLHLGKGGRLEVGDPPDIDKHYQELKREVQHWARQVPYRKIGIGLAVFIVVVTGFRYLFGAAERLDSVAEVAAHALGDGDPAALESLAAPGTADDVRRWYDAVHPRLLQLRGQWGEKTEEVEVHVAQEDQALHKGAVGVSIHPVLSGARDVSLADPANATAAASGVFEEATDWTLTRWGRWKLDGKATYARIVPAATAPPATAP